MIAYNNIQAVYFLGIGGIGMSALARYFKLRGKLVAGYDRSPSPLTQEMEKEGIAIHFTDEVSAIPRSFLELPKTDVLVVITPAIPANHTELNFFKEEGYTLVKRSEVLGLITRETFGIGIAGTHGKTTTSAITSHLLEASALKPAAFVGGIMANYGTNFLPGMGGISVMEADEFDRSFLRLHPSVAVITAMDPDHLDIYGTEENFREGFLQYASQVVDGGKLIVHESLCPFFKDKAFISYGIGETADVRAKNIRVENGRFVFDIDGIFTLENLSLAMPGRHNVSNAVAALSAAYFAGAPLDKLALALASFKGVKRRFELMAENAGKVYIDDYAHHPKELDACISAARELFPGKRIFGAFQPHLFSRTRDFAEGFAQSLSALDYLYLLPIYPARELPIEGVTSEFLQAQISCPNEIVSKTDLAKSVSLDLGNFDVLLTMGAGDIDQVVGDLQKIISA